MLFGKERKKKKDSESDLKGAFSDKIIDAMEFKRFECVFMRASDRVRSRAHMCVCWNISLGKQSIKATCHRISNNFLDFRRNYSNFQSNSINFHPIFYIIFNFFCIIIVSSSSCAMQTMSSMRFCLFVLFYFNPLNFPIYFHRDWRLRTMTSNEKRVAEREALRSVIQQWNANRLDLFELSEPDEASEKKRKTNISIWFAWNRLSITCDWSANKQQHFHMDFPF